MTVQYSAVILESNIAPGASSFKTADIPDASLFDKESGHWIDNFFLNSTFRGAFSAPLHAYALNIIRRIQQAFSEHHLARTHTLDFLSAPSPQITRYMRALYHWECFLGQTWHAYNLIAKASNQTVFDKDDRTTANRLNALYNQMKHVESRIENGQMPAGATVPVWMENEGLRSTDAHLSFSETGDVLRELAKYANLYVDPPGVKNLTVDPEG